MLQARKIPYYVFGGLHSFKSVCSLVIDQSRNLVIATEIADNPGTSITNAVDLLANQVCDEFKLDKQKLTWIERYTEQSYKGKGNDRNYPSYSIVNFVLKNNKLVQGQHKYLKPVNFLSHFDNYGIE